MRIWDDPAELDRMVPARRNPAEVRVLWQDPATRVLPVDARGSFAVAGLAGPDRWQNCGEVILGTRAPGYQQPPTVRLATGPATGPYDPDRHWLLGKVEGAPLFCELRPEVLGASLREVGASLPAEQAQAAAMAEALAVWHSTAQHCPRCGGPTAPDAAGLIQRCHRCDRELFCRTDPAVIVAVTDAEDRLLLGHQASWPDGRYSVLAGFVEAGESLEQAVCREVAEECGVQVERPRYVASQPWPFPRSIMLGFRARALDTQITVDAVEIADARWFTRDQLRAEVAAGTMLLPGESSIAFRLIHGWLTGADPVPAPKDVAGPASPHTTP